MIPVSANSLQNSPAVGAAETAKTKPTGSATNSSTKALAGIAEATDTASISTLASRLSKAATATAEATAGLSYTALREKVLENTQTIHYPFEGAAKAAAAKEQPEPNDAVSAKSASAATAFLNGKAPNPFARLSREQLATISNDESGTFTINERRAASTQAHKEEEAWRMQVVAQSSQEYSQTGKLTKFFQSVLDHFNQLPALEQATYPQNYAADLQAKVDLDFNYWNHSPGDSGPTPGSLADIFGEKKTGNLFDLLDALTVNLEDQDNKARAIS